MTRSKRTPNPEQLIGPAERYDLELDAVNPGVWMVHCHIEHHMANGMMTTVWYEGHQPTGPAAGAMAAQFGCGDVASVLVAAGADPNMSSRSVVPRFSNSWPVITSIGTADWPSVRAARRVPVVMISSIVSSAP